MYTHYTQQCSVRSFVRSFIRFHPYNRIDTHVQYAYNSHSQLNGGDGGDGGGGVAAIAAAVVGKISFDYFIFCLCSFCPFPRISCSVPFISIERAHTYSSSPLLSTLLDLIFLLVAALFFSLSSV